MKLFEFAVAVMAFNLAAWGQDAGMMAAQQANQQAIQASQLATQQAIQANQQASQQAMQANQQATWAAQQGNNNYYCCRYTATPKFSIKPGKYPSSVTLRLTDNTRGAVIYYTTDGWTPTALSTRYTGPITIDSSTVLQVVAFGPNGIRSRLTVGSYEITTPAPPAAVAVPPQNAAAQPPADATPGELLLAHGTAVPLIFTSSVDSKTAYVGDKISFQLADDLKSGDTVLVKKGAVATGVVTEADKSRGMGVPGEVFFEVDTLQADGTVIKLHGFAAREGQDHAGKAVGVAVIPVFGPTALLVHGQEAEIAEGTPFKAFVDADTWVQPAK